MYKCSHCKKEFINKPYICYPNKKKYCSLQCIPDSAMDKPYSFQYFNLIDSIRDIESRIENIKTLEDRINLENDVNDLSYTYTLEIYGEELSLFYNRQISILLPILEELYDRIHNIFMNRKYESSPAVIICWENLINILGREVASLVFDYFKEDIENFIFENGYYLNSPYKYKTIDFDNYEDMLKFPIVSDTKEVHRLFLDCLNIFRPEFTEKQLEEMDTYSQCIEIDTLYYCVVCKHWELWEHFSFYENLKLYKCDEHCGCEEYDNLYLEHNLVIGPWKPNII